MVDDTEHAAADSTGSPEPVEPGDPAEPTGSGRSRTFDRRTVAITLCVALVAAIVAGLVASAMLGDDDATGSLQLSEPGAVDTSRLLSEPATTVDGRDTNLGSFLEEQPMLVNFWQSSCVPCVEEMPLLEQARAANPDLTVVGVATQDRLPQAKALAAQTKVTYPWIQDPSGTVYYEAKGKGMPTTVLLSADGDVIATKTGAFHSERELQAFIDRAS